MNGSLDEEEKPVLLKIQNSRNPAQVIKLVLDRSNGHFETEGLKDFFGLEEIRLGMMDVLESLSEYADLLSFLLEAMSAAENLHLPFVYENEFEFHGVKYTLYNEGGYRVLRRVESGDALGGGA